jgi:DNA-binding PucR family transcriptional regulator
MTTISFLKLLATDAPAIEFDAHYDRARVYGSPAEALDELAEARRLALQVRHLLDTSRQREAELSALFETAGDLASRTELQSILEAIVARARRLLRSDISYLTLVDQEAGDSYTTVTDGGASALFNEVRVPMGEGIGGRVAQTGIPYSTPNYFEDDRIKHTRTTDSAVRDEGLVSLLGVPLMLEHRVIGVLFAANRTQRPFAAADTALLASLGAHAAIAIDKARLRSESQSALNDLRVAGKLLRKQNADIRRAAEAHDRLTALVLRGGDLADVADEVKSLLGAEVFITDKGGAPIATTNDDEALLEQLADLHVRTLESMTTQVEKQASAAAVVAGADTLGSIALLRHVTDPADLRVLERAAQVTGLLLLFRRSLAASELRVRGELLDDVLLDRAEEGMIERARLLGVDSEAPFALLVIEVQGDRNRLADSAAHLAATRRGLSTVHGGRLVVAIPSRDARETAETVSSELARIAGQRLTIGFSRSVRGVRRVRAAYTEARTCLETLLALERRGQVADIDDLGFIGLLLSKNNDVSGFVRLVLGPLLDYDAERGTSLEETLKVYFENAGNINQTGLSMHLHPKTVAQRLDRVSQLLGPDWNSPDSRLQVQIALHLKAVLRRLDGSAHR